MEENNKELEEKVKRKAAYTILRRDVRALKQGQSAMSKDVKRIKGWVIRQKRYQSFGWRVLQWTAAGLLNVGFIFAAFFILVVVGGIPLKEALPRIFGI